MFDINFEKLKNFKMTKFALIVNQLVNEKEKLNKIGIWKLKERFKSKKKRITNGFHINEIL